MKRDVDKMRNVNVVCVNWGTKYSTEYVVRLYQMVKKNTTHKFEMFCLTDNPDIYPDGITGVKLKTGFEGWWNKMQLFRNDMLPVGEYLYFDLDVVIVDNIDCLFEYKGFGITRDFINPEIGLLGGKEYNSSIMRFTQNSAIWKHFKVNESRWKAAQAKTPFFGDQNVISDFLNKSGFDSPFPDQWSWSFKIGSLRGRRPIDHNIFFGAEIPEGGKVCVFHGEPNPDQVNVEWVNKHWKNQTSESFGEQIPDKSKRQGFMDLTLDDFMDFRLDEALKKGIDAHKAGRIEEAGKIYTTIIQAEPTHPDANHKLGLLSVGVGKIEEALTFFKVALTANPSVGQFWLSYIDCLVELGRSVEAQALVYQAKYQGTASEIVDQLERRLTVQGLKVNDTNTRKVEASRPAKSNILDSIKLDKALRLAKQQSKAGQLEEAKNIFTDILQKFPKNKLALAALSALASDYNSRANALMKKGNADAAIGCYKQAIELDPTSADAYNNMGNLLAYTGDLKASINCYQQAIKINPTFAAAYNNLGLSLMDQGETELAISSYQKAVKIKPDHADAYNNMGNALNSQGDKEAAIYSYKQAVKIKPNHAEAYNNMGNLLRNEGDAVAALVCYQQVLQINPAHAGAHNNIGLAQIDQGDADAALISYKEAIRVDPTYAEAHHNIAIALRVGGRLEAAITSFKQAIYLNPHHTGAYNNMGNAQRDNGDLDAALDSYKQALNIKPSAETHFNMGIALTEKGDLETAMESYKRAIRIKSNYADAHMNKASLHLRLLDFEAGWLSYEWRWKVLKEVPQFLETSKPLWKPSMRQRVLLWGEQGLGDEIMFASLILDMHSLSSKLIVQTDERLVDLFKRSFPDDIDFRPHDEVVSETEYDAHMPLGSAPLYFRQTIESFKGRSEGWLFACSTRAKTLRSELLRDDSEVLIGISWHTTAHLNGAQNRLISLNQIAQMLQAPKVRLVSLQYGDFVNEIKKLSTDCGIKVAQVTEIDNMNDIDGLAALISACDRIVSIDNATVHLAGALGKETKVLLPHDCEWRWGQSTQDSYWYDSVQLHRQVIIGDWEYVIKNYETLTKSKPITSSI